MPNYGSDFNLPVTRTLTPDEIAARNENYGNEGRNSTPPSDTATVTLVSSKFTSTETLAAERSAGQSIGAYVADLPTKAAEGISKIASDFGNNIPFLKAGASLPSFSSLLSPSSIVASAKGVIGSLFGGAGGVIPKSLTNVTSLAGSGASASAINSAIGTGTSGEDRSHIVKLTQVDNGDVVEFIVMPEIVENRSVSYEAVAPSQFPGAFQKYKGTESVQWSINATFISRTSTEATTNLKFVNRLRGWTMPYFGERTRLRYPTKLGAPPPTLMLEGLRKSIIGKMPVVITSLSWNWPKDVDYIPATATDGSANNIPFPVVLNVAIQCVESLSTTEFNNFNLDDYRKGLMIDSFKPNSADTALAQDYDYGETPQEAQVTNRNENYSNEGRNSIAPTSAADYSNEGRNHLTPITETKTASTPTPFKGGGGDFAGGGASGNWDNSKASAAVQPTNQDDPSAARTEVRRQAFTKKANAEEAIDAYTSSNQNLQQGVDRLGATPPGPLYQKQIAINNKRIADAQKALAEAQAVLNPGS